MFALIVADFSDFVVKKDSWRATESTVPLTEPKRVGRERRASDKLISAYVSYLPSPAPTHT